MNGADHLFAAILLISLVLGCLRGFVRESISLLSWLIGLWLAWHFAYLLYPWLGGALAEPPDDPPHAVARAARTTAAPQLIAFLMGVR